MRAQPPLRIIKVLSAPPDVVFDHWIDARGLAAWMRAGAATRAEAELDARVGGRFRIVMKDAEAEHEHTGEYLVLDRPRKLVFTWISKATGWARTTVTVELRSLGNDRTELTLTHEGLPESALPGHRSGWGDIAEKLERAVRGQAGGSADRPAKEE
jgi:uncharacterized protein YndB with AHSA1/START domain